MQLAAATEERDQLRRQLGAAQAEFEALRATRTFRYTRAPRAAYARLRRARSSDRIGATAGALAAADPLAEEFAQRGPWVTRFTIEGRAYGGDIELSNDRRARWFLDRFPDASRVLELGSLEGGHSFQLAQAGLSVVAIEGRAENIERARFVQDLLAVRDVRFVEGDLERAKLTDFGTFDAVFCLGLLYHLSRPWELIDQFRDVAPGLFVWTHYADEAEVEVGGLDGRWYTEHGRADPLSGLSRRSFWPTLPALLRRLESVGFGNIEIVEDEALHPHGAAVTLAARVDAGGTGERLEPAP